MEVFRSLGRHGRKLAGVSLLALLVTAAIPVAAAETVKIYRSTMPDGSVVLSDKPASGARSVASDSYVLTAPRGAAEAERDYWRRQADAFNLRQQQRQIQAPVRRASPRAMNDVSSDDAGWYPPVAYGAPHPGQPLVPLHRVPREYGSSPGASRGRDSGFIGSGFSTSR